MTKLMKTLPVMMVVMLVGLIPTAQADRFFSGRGRYDQRANYNGDFTNREAWSGRIVDAGPGWFEIVRYGEQIRVRVVEGRARLFIGERVRLVPFRRDGKAEIAEIRLAEEGFRPVGVGRYQERRVPKEASYYRYDGRGQRGTQWDIDIRIDRSPRGRRR